MLTIRESRIFTYRHFSGPKTIVQKKFVKTNVVQFVQKIYPNFFFDSIFQYFPLLSIIFYIRIIINSHYYNKKEEIAVCTNQAFLQGGEPLSDLGRSLRECKVGVVIRHTSLW